MTADLGPAARRETWCVCGAPHRGPCTRCVPVDAAPPRPIPTLEDRMTAPDRIPVDCIRLGCGHTVDQHHRMAGDTADTRSQDRAIRELTAERDDALASLRDVLAELRYSTAELRAAQEQIAMHSTPADEQTTEPDADADLADALERAESGRIDRDDSVWWPRADGLWITRYLEPMTLDRLEALFGPTRTVLLVDIEQDDEQEATAAGLGSPADRAQDPAEPAQTAADSRCGVAHCPDPQHRTGVVVGGNPCCGGNGVEASCPECREGGRG